ncbi:hypothetical protein NBO_27g0011 [Nosema bombycis CQ1]|uniref:Uncharacterized protein n=1 Tax=Nosema bombycis (strain CQ1 / CVCC 102059) TaxID=578461 RepID=R0M925_NOSB1|nr:hypothetical protein NBO_27g0011 [Nosema bombycis CQ1]|eukprot:EOB14454.1 hypothetical protein NBO_27g0011 [Nosema bombycis CQ1]
MSLKARIEKINRIITAQKSTTDIIENLKPLEHLITEGLDNDQESCLYPNEPNFQLPNVFLKTKISSELKNYIKSNDGVSNFTTSIDLVLDKLESFELFETEINLKDTIEDEVLNFIVANREGGI